MAEQNISKEALELQEKAKQRVQEHEAALNEMKEQGIIKDEGFLFENSNDSTWLEMKRRFHMHEDDMEEMKRSGLLKETAGDVTNDIDEGKAICKRR